MPRSELGDHDRSRWETGLDGRERDPWGEVHYLGLRRLDDDSLVVFSTSSDGGRKAIAQIAKAAASRPGEAPIVTLGSELVPAPELRADHDFHVRCGRVGADSPRGIAGACTRRGARRAQSCGGAGVRSAAPDRLNDDVDSLFGPMPPLSAYSADDGL